MPSSVTSSTSSDDYKMPSRHCTSLRDHNQVKFLNRSANTNTYRLQQLQIPLIELTDKISEYHNEQDGSPTDRQERAEMILKRNRLAEQVARIIDEINGEQHRDWEDVLEAAWMDGDDFNSETSSSVGEDDVSMRA
ncbi:hypothetical protein AOL_s00188g228 [Orbilia oligospora ATCC 24927]|uniref:Uncharacterized protein n=2 Tax=Orbilia oligospora TaxID=2813651 RepID=G1XQL6_ARTOA|nr:hypothetical protein AOL_s00188g228 [Orbilia oligospora ATCC 24927]EGX44560.1 hypothetical protein AOL_s00188g228 [Orbilia oligospora ATCC 24927]KAF3280527.1 hypothetical protein TWF970_002748 [Orbilia oligospora]